MMGMELAGRCTSHEYLAAIDLKRRLEIELKMGMNG